MKRSSRTSVLAAQVALLLAFVLGGCSQKREINGQVFVVTKGRENVKMGLVHIHAVSAEQLAPIAAELLKTYKQADLKERQALAQQVVDLAALRQFENQLGALEPAGLNLPEFRAWREESAQRRRNFIVKCGRFMSGLNSLEAYDRPY